MGLEVHAIPALQDNYIFVGREPYSGDVFVVDPTLAEPVLSFLADRKWTPKCVINTHHHWDHTDGNLEVQAATGCEIWGYEGDAARIPGLTRKLSNGESVGFGAIKFQVKEAVGHTLGHILLWFQEEKVLFSGDTLFSLGCGRLFEGSPDQMWATLNWIRGLPLETQVYFAHEYTERNGQFALGIDSTNEELKRYLRSVAAMRNKGEPSTPTRIETERSCNPFLRADSESLRGSLGLKMELSDAEVFAHVRRLRDQF